MLGRDAQRASACSSVLKAGWLSSVGDRNMKVGILPKSRNLCGHPSDDFTAQRLRNSVVADARCFKGAGTGGSDKAIWLWGPRVHQFNSATSLTPGAEGLPR